MPVCPFCKFGWPKQIAEIYQRHIETAGDSAMHFGPAHVVWEDENFERESVQWCLDHFDEYAREDHIPEEHAAVRQSLIELLALPDDILDPFADVDWDSDPSTWTAPAGIEFVRV
jgi:hypothetical protein